MPAIFYQNADGKVIRRVYRSEYDLRGIQRSIANGTSRTDLSAADVQDRIDAATYRVASDPGPPGKSSSLRRKEAWLTGLYYFVKRNVSTAAGYLNLSQDVLAWRAAKDVDAEVARLEELAETARLSWVRYQEELRQKWLLGNENERLVQQYNDRVPLTVAQASALRFDMVTREQMNVEVARAKDEFAARVEAAQTPEAQNALLVASLAALKTELADMKQTIAARNAAADENNTVTNLKEAGVEAFVPKTAVEKAHHDANKQEASAMQETLAYLKKNAANPAVKKAAGALTTAFIGAYVTPKLYARKKVDTAREIERLKAEDAAYVAKGEATAQQRQAKGQDLMDRMAAIRGQVLEKNWQQVYGWIESWGLMTEKHSYSFSDLEKFVTGLEDAVNNKRRKGAKS